MLCGATKDLITSADTGADLIVLCFRVAKVVEVGLVVRVVDRKSTYRQKTPVDLREKQVENHQTILHS